MHLWRYTYPGIPDCTIPIGDNKELIQNLGVHSNQLSILDLEVILTEIRNKNHLAFKRLFDSLYGELAIYAQGYLFEKASSEDVVQEVFVCLWEKSEEINIKTDLKAYLYAMVRNRCLNHLKKVKITDAAKMLEAQAAFDTDYHPDWFAEDEKKVQYDQVLSVIEKLPNKMRTIVKLRFLDNYRYNEIANELGVSTNTVKTQLKRAKLKFEQLIVSMSMMLFFL